MLKALELHIGEEMRIFIIQINYKADIDLIVFQVIHEGAARLLEPHRPAHGMGHLALVVIFWLHFPDLFHTKAKLGHIAFRVQIIFSDDLL